MEIGLNQLGKVHVIQVAWVHASIIISILECFLSEKKESCSGDQLYNEIVKSYLALYKSQLSELKYEFPIRTPFFFNSKLKQVLHTELKIVLSIANVIHCFG